MTTSPAPLPEPSTSPPDAPSPAAPLSDEDSRLLAEAIALGLRELPAAIEEEAA